MLQARPRLEQVTRRAEEVRTPGEIFPGVRRLLVVRNDRLGDLVLTAPAIDALRRAYPQAWLGVIVRPALIPIARMLEGVDVTVEDDGSLDGLAAAVGTFRPDLAVCIAPGARAPWAAFRAHVPHRVGPGFRVYSPLFERRVEEHRSSGLRHEAELALAYAHRAGAPGGVESFALRVADPATETLDGWLAAQHVEPPWVLLHPGSGGSCPAWPPGHFARLAALLRGEGVRVVVSIGPADEAAARALDDSTPEVRRLPRFGGDLTTLAALLARSAVVVSNSTGPLHLAAGLGAPTLALHAPWPTCGVGRWGPYAANGWALVADLPEALSWSRSDRRRLGSELMAAVPPTTALAVTLSLLEGATPRL